MSPTTSPTEVTDAIRDPGRAFDHPREVLDAPGLSRDDKRRVLEQWRVDAEALSAAEGENMGGGEGAPIAQIADALRALDAGDD